MRRPTTITRLLLSSGLVLWATALVRAQTLFVTNSPSEVSTVSSSGGTAATLVTSGLGGLAGPLGVRRGPDGLVYVVDQAASVHRYRPDGTVDATFVLPTTTGLTTPFDVAFHPRNGRMYLTDFTGRIFVYDLYLNTLVTTITSTLFASASFLCFTPSGDCFFSDPVGSQVLKIPDGSTTPVVFVPASSGGPTPCGVAFAATRLYVATWSPDQVLMYDIAGAYVGVEAALTAGDQPLGLAIDEAGKVHVACYGANEVRRFDANGGGNALVVCPITAPVGLDFKMPPRAPFPLKQGELVTTCYADGPFVQQWTNPLDLVVKVVDTRTGGPTGEHWEPPMFSNEYPVGPNTWNLQNLGQVFGLTIDDAPAPNIFVASSTAFGPAFSGPGGFGAVYKLGGCDGRIYKWLVTGSGAVGTNTLPNTGPGLGNICYDRRHQQFFVSDLENGKIYRVKDQGTQGLVVQVWDPFFADGGSGGFAPLGERVWAVHVSNDYDPDHLLFSVWLRDEVNTGTAWPTHADWGPAPAAPNNAIFSVRLNFQGKIVGTPTLFKVMPYLSLTQQYSNPVSDITSSPRLLYLAERTMFGDVGAPFLADQSRLTRMAYAAGGPLWLNQLQVGDGGTAGWNCAGGVALTYAGNLHDYYTSRVWSTGEQLHDGLNDYVDGLQSIRFAGNQLDVPFTTKSKLVDIDGSLFPWHRTLAGDVEYVRVDADTSGCPQPTGGGGGGSGG